MCARISPLHGLLLVVLVGKTANGVSVLSKHGELRDAVVIGRTDPQGWQPPEMAGEREADVSGQECSNSQSSPKRGATAAVEQPLPG